MTALQGFRVLELAEGVAGEYCGKLLADFGAEIIKLEKPGAGSPTRQMEPLKRGVEGPEASGLYAYLNTGKRSVSLDVSAAGGKAALHQLLARVDAVIDDHPGCWLRQLGLDKAGVAECWPRLVACAITPYGFDDDSVAEDLNVFHSSGWGYHTPSGADNSRPPLKGAGRFMVSYESALDAALCTVAALFERETSGRGQFIDISRQAVMASRIDYVLAPMIAGDMAVSNDRRAFDLAGPSGIFPCRDGYVYIWMSAPSHWQALHKLMGEPQWMASFPDNWLERECTPERVALTREKTILWLAGEDKHDVSAKSQQLGLTMVPLNTAPDLLDNEQFQFRGFFRELHHPALGPTLYPTVPYRLSATPAVTGAPAPTLGRDTDDILMTIDGGEG